jgi:hypothetical protein
MTQPATTPLAAARKLEVTARYLHQNARMAIHDVYDALVELITNADDRYVVLKHGGRIEIEVERRRKDVPSIIRVRDFADGMTLPIMEQKLGRFGERVSGMADGHSVRGTNSRGAKDVAVLGGVVFESIAQDGAYHKCEITPRLEFQPHGPSAKVTPAHRTSLGIAKGTGTLVTITVDSSRTVPHHDKLRQNLRRLVPLHDIIASPDRVVVLRDLSQPREEQIEPARIEGHEVLSERFLVPGYPTAEAKLVIRRATERFEDVRPKFRPGGIVIKSRHAVHEATLFAPELEHDPHAAWFFGRLTCDYIDDLWNEFDDNFEKNLPQATSNPDWIIDPMRKAGLRRDHPFTKALFQQALSSPPQNLISAVFTRPRDDRDRRLATSV